MAVVQMHSIRSARGGVQHAEPGVRSRPSARPAGMWCLPSGDRRRILPNVISEDALLKVAKFACTLAAAPTCVLVVGVGVNLLSDRVTGPVGLDDRSCSPSQ